MYLLFVPSVVAIFSNNNPTKTEGGGEFMFSGRIRNACSTTGYSHVIFKRHKHNWYGNLVEYQYVLININNIKKNYL